eukprot:TRINITY_DN37196_c0_g1_i1.p1 TRINITY_DN37196_c0_g1~~TRINITY_DN37196_c0_g1_i1.p1  ORF type:complete len:448 (+),score=42.94 TRINITY_DN37196_c0_g1_i1:88-1344(+)
MMTRRTTLSARFLAIILSGYIVVDTAIRYPSEGLPRSAEALPRSKRIEIPSQGSKPVDETSKNVSTIKIAEALPRSKRMVGESSREANMMHTGDALPRSVRKELPFSNGSQVQWHVTVHVSQLAKFILGHHTSIVMTNLAESYELVFFAPSRPRKNEEGDPGGLRMTKLESSTMPKSHDNPALKWSRSWSYGATEKTPFEVQKAMRPYFEPESYNLCMKNCNVFVSLGLLYATGFNKDWRSAEKCATETLVGELPDFDVKRVKEHISRPVKKGDLVFLQTDSSEHTFKYVASKRDVNDLMSNGVKLVEPAKHFRSGDLIYIHCFNSTELTRCKNKAQTTDRFYETDEDYLPCYLGAITKSKVQLVDCGFDTTDTEVAVYTIDIGKTISRKAGASPDAPRTINIFHYDASPVKALGWTT